MAKRKDRSKPHRSGPDNPLPDIQQLMRDGKVEIEDDAVRGADSSFGWKIADIREAILKLEQKHYYKTDNHWFRKPEENIKVDYYKARGLMRENVYIYLHVEDGWLVIVSFKEI